MSTKPVSTTGFISPAEDYYSEGLNIFDRLVENPPATFIFKNVGNEMAEAGILDGSFLVVDRSKKPKHKEIGLFVWNGEFIVRHLHVSGIIHLAPANPKGKWQEVREVQCEGKVIWVIQQPLSLFSDVWTR